MPIDDPALTLYFHPLASYCWKVLVALYEAQTPFKKIQVDGLPKSHPVLAGFWPIGKMPVLHDAQRDCSIPESSIIVEYLQQYHPGSVRLIPDDAAAALETRLWDRFFDLYIHNPMQKQVSDYLRPDHEKDPAASETNATLETAYTMLEQRMADRHWAIGDHFTMADCAAMPALFYAQTVYPFSQAYPAIAAYFERLIARPSVRRTIQEARPYFQFFPFHAALQPRFNNPDLK